MLHAACSTIIIIVILTVIILTLLVKLQALKLRGKTELGSWRVDLERIMQKRRVKTFDRDRYLPIKKTKLLNHCRKHCI